MQVHLYILQLISVCLYLSRVRSLIGACTKKRDTTVYYQFQVSNLLCSPEWILLVILTIAVSHQNQFVSCIGLVNWEGNTHILHSARLIKFCEVLIVQQSKATDSHFVCITWLLLRNWVELRNYVEIIWNIRKWLRILSVAMIKKWKGMLLTPYIMAVCKRYISELILGYSCSNHSYIIG